MNRLTASISLLAVLTTAVSPAAAADRDDAGRADRLASDAIDQGVAFLRRHQDLLETSEYASSYPGGTTCLAYYTLLICGVPADDPDLEALEKRVIQAVREESQTYTLSLALMGLLTAGKEGHGALIAELIGRLEVGQARQRAQGAWGYVLPPGRTADRRGGRPPTRRVAHWDAPENWWDNSNSQYAILALRSAVDFGYRVDPEVFARAARHLLREQKRDGGFAYSRTHRDHSYSGMTAGVAGSLVMCSDLLGEGNDSRALRRGIRRAVEKSKGWLGSRLSWPSADSPWPYYTAYAVERLGHFAQVDRFGSRRWYDEGARWLVSIQRDDGAWAVQLRMSKCDTRGKDTKRSRSRGPVFAPDPSLSDTCFALLFLKRSSYVHTRISDEVSVLLRGIDSQARRSELESIRGRILNSGRRAVPQLVKGLFLPAEPARLLADECLRELTGSDMGFQDARDDHELRRARESWVRFAMQGTEEEP